MSFLQPKSSKINPHTISQATGRMSAWRPSRITLNFASRVPGGSSRLEARRFSGNPVSVAYAGTLQGVRGRKRQEVDTSRASRTTGEDSLSREIIRFGANLSGAATCRFLPRYLPVTFRIRPGNRIARKSSPFHTRPRNPTPPYRIH